MLLLAASVTHAQKPFQDGGILTAITQNEVHLPDRSYTLLATTKVILENNIKGNLSDIKPGQTVLLTIIRLDQKNLVDAIRILEP